MKITPATFEDIPELRLLVESSFIGEPSMRGWTHVDHLIGGTRCTEESLREDMSKPGAQFFKCVDEEENEGKIIGCVYALLQTKHESEMEMYTGMLCVTPEKQDKGLGKRLISVVEDLAKEKGCKAVTISVFKSRTELVEFYERRGFKKTGETEPILTDEITWKPKVPLELIILKKAL